MLGLWPEVQALFTEQSELASAFAKTARGPGLPSPDWPFTARTNPCLERLTRGPWLVLGG